ncbi:aldo/keto reductase [Pseudomaricurvus alcaniphilus]|uniref:aldo/keto reductase n=1 Tax=Pseudomaricurvus alcaniphilus TaxID=1166482 RepID=UPI0014079C9B|nr:aldo/keto reductase [Pseudomaricurvus alcaniphilus]NHN37366.1 aldo/keto reductase [Pseudomaricurvus alcaniphilus]
MKYQFVGQSDLSSSRLVYGCMRLTSKDYASSRKMVEAALAAGYNHFDHADIYGGGSCETAFGKIWRELGMSREKIIVTSKCGIRLANSPQAGYPKRYDFSREHILHSVDVSLSRLDCDYLDMLLLHRPDYLFDASEVAEAFASLKNSGKVRHFGVSNFTTAQVALLHSVLPMPLLVHQVEVNLSNLNALHDGTLEQCQQLKITPQAWSPLAGSILPTASHALGADTDLRLQEELAAQAQKYGAAPWLIVLAWILRHPAGIAPIIGTTSPARIAESVAALGIDYRREDWYRLLEARNGSEVP